MIICQVCRNLRFVLQDALDFSLQLSLLSSINCYSRQPFPNHFSTISRVYYYHYYYNHYHYYCNLQQSYHDPKNDPAKANTKTTAAQLKPPSNNNSPTKYSNKMNTSDHQVSEPRPVEYVPNTNAAAHQAPEPGPSEHQDTMDASDDQDSTTSHQGTTYRLNEDGVWVQDDQATESPDDDPEWTFVDDGTENSVLGNDDAPEENRIRSHSPSFVSAHSDQDTITEGTFAPHGPDAQSIASDAESSGDSWVTEGRSRAGSVGQDGSEASIHESESVSAHSGRSGVVPENIHVQGNVQSSGDLNVRNAGNGITISSSISPNIGVSASIQSSNFVCNSGNGMRISSLNDPGRPGFRWQITPGVSRGQSNVQGSSNLNTSTTAGAFNSGANASVSINGTQIPNNTSSQNGRVFRYQAIQGQNLDNATISNCCISGCSGRNLRITDSTFSGCNLSDSTIEGSRFTGSNLRDCVLRNCRISHSNVSGGSRTDCVWNRSNVH